MKNTKKVTDSELLKLQEKERHENCHYDFGKYIEYNGLNVKGLKNQLIEGILNNK